MKGQIEFAELLLFFGVLASMKSETSDVRLVAEVQACLPLISLKPNPGNT
jgi:hypothetical protein